MLRVLAPAGTRASRASRASLASFGSSCTRFDPAPLARRWGTAHALFVWGSGSCARGAFGAQSGTNRFGQLRLNFPEGTQGTRLRRGLPRQLAGRLGSRLRVMLARAWGSEKARLALLAFTR